MKRFAAALMICGAVLATGANVHAQDYPPAENPTASVDDSTPAAGSTFGVQITQCIVGESVNWNFQGQVATTTCVASAAGGTSSAQFTAPTTAGTYTGTAALVQSETVVTFTVVVQGAAGTPVGEIPATGSGSTLPTLTIAGVLLAAGVGMFLVAQFRRREATAG